MAFRVRLSRQETVDTTHVGRAVVSLPKAQRGRLLTRGVHLQISPSDTAETQCDTRVEGKAPRLCQAAGGSTLSRRWFEGKLRLGSPESLKASSHRLSLYRRNM